MSTLRDIRKGKKRTLGEISRATGLTESYLSQIERGMKEPSIEALRKICGALDVPITAYWAKFSDSAGQENCILLKAASRNLQSYYYEEFGKSVTMDVLSPEQGESGIRLVLANVPKGLSVSGKQIAHAYAETAYVLSGAAQALIGKQVFEMSAGDSMFVSSMVEHDYVNVSENDLKMLFSFHD